MLLVQSPRNEHICTKTFEYKFESFNSRTKSTLCSLKEEKQNYSWFDIHSFRAGRYTGIKSMLRYFVRTDIDIEQIFLYRQTGIP